MYMDAAGKGAPMSVTPIDLDEEALARAMAELGTTTKKDTVNLALREVAERRSRLRAFEKLMQLGDADAGYQAWRERKDLAPHQERDDDA
jgi:Arc/MetJ family transcription regulator